MKRSEINQAIKDMEKLLQKYCMSLPPFCSWTPEEWADKNSEYDEIRDNQLGWDITDFGKGHFDTCGFALITLRNGNQKNKAYKKVYAEKYLMLKEGQTALMHYHWYKSEDLINRAGGTLLITLYNGNEEREKLATDVLVNKDGRSFYVKAGTTIELLPGESLTIWQYQYHDFAVKEGTGSVVIGEVSQCNDDESDNCFFENTLRFPQIEEDEKPYRFLCTEYPKLQ